MSTLRQGRLSGIGVGPGDPELLTLKGLRLLRSAAVVAYPAPEHGDSFARAIVVAWLDRGQREIAIRFPMRPGPPPAEIYDDAAGAIAAELDHSHLNDHAGLESPTLEALCVFFADRLGPTFPSLKRIVVSRPTVGETCALEVG